MYIAKRHDKFCVVTYTDSLLFCVLQVEKYARNANVTSAAAGEVRRVLKVLRVTPASQVDQVRKVLQVLKANPAPLA